MKSFWKFFSGNKDPYCQKHRQYISRLCCNDKCVHQKINLICLHPECSDPHRTHSTISFQVYQQLVGYIEKQIKHKKQVKAGLSGYKRQLINSINNIFDKIEAIVDQYLNKRCSSKVLIEIQKKFKYEQHFKEQNKKDFYSQFLPLFPKIETIYTRQFVSNQILKKIQFLAKRSTKNLNFEFLGLDTSFFPSEDIKEIREYSKEEKLKKILPFKCQLNLKFKGSQHKFLSNKLYSTDIRGPIILIAQSHKNRIFGGFSPVMFPKTEEYIQDNKSECFLFSLDDKCLLPIKEQFKQYSIRGGKNFWFGRGDLAISDECQKGNISWAQIGRAYRAPALAYGNQSYWLAGAWYFRVIEYQIFEVDIEAIK